MGSWVAEALCKRGIRVRAGIHEPDGAATEFKDISNVKPVVIDILQAAPLYFLCALDGADICLSFRSLLIDPIGGQ